MWDIGKRLRERRENAGLTQGQVAAYEGYDVNYISKLERGTNHPNVWPLLARLAERYRTTTDYILGLTDDPGPQRSEALPAPVREVVALALAWPEARQQELLAHAQVLDAARRAANLGEYDRLMAMFAAAEDGPVLVAMIEDLLRAVDVGDAAAVRRLLGHIVEGRGAAAQQPHQANEHT